jgi:hypothetical protein
MKYLFFLLFSIIFTSPVDAIGQKNIIYEFPDLVTKKIKTYIEGDKKSNDTTKFILKLGKVIDGKYSLSIIKYDFENNRNFKEMEEYLIKRNSRYVKVYNNYYSLITDEDFLFADFGASSPRNGQTGKKKILFYHDSPQILFDTKGKIYSKQ